MVMPPMAKAKESKDRLQELLRGAFAGAPTPLKDIPKKDGETRSVAKKAKAKKRKKKPGK
jgi:hypothetical protein